MNDEGTEESTVDASTVSPTDIGEGWTEIGTTDEPLTMGSGLTFGPARLYLEPVESPVFGAIDLASEDRTPVLETTVSPAEGLTRFRDAVMKATESFAAFTNLVTPDTGDQTHAAWKHEMLEQIYGPLTHHRRQVALLGSGYRRHRAPRGERPAWMSRAEHARRRRLYSERLRRDRRRIRKGRAPILRSSQFQMLIPRAQVDVRKTGPEFAGMEIVLSPMVPDDQVFIVNTDLLKQHEFVEPKVFDFGEAERRAARYRDQAAIYGYGMSPTGRFRTTNYFGQMLHAYDAERPWFQGHSADHFWVDETADWAPEHSSDEDRWVNEGGADRG